MCDLLPQHICMRQRAISVRNELQFPFEAAHYPCPLPSLSVTLPRDSCTLRTFGQNPSQDPANQYATGTFLIMQFIHSMDCLYPHFLAWTTYIPISPLVFFLFLQLFHCDRENVDTKTDLCFLKEIINSYKL